MKFQPTNNVNSLAAGISLAIYPGQPASAQDFGDPVLEEVLVTATLRTTSLQAVPQSISAFTGDDLLRNNIQTLEDAVRALPSLGLVALQPGRNDLVYRGISTGPGQFFTDSKIAVYVDDIPMSLASQQPFPHFVDIERLESLPGPQGTLFGAASQTGTLRIITNKPNLDGVSGSAYTEIATTKGGEPSFEVNGWVNVPIGDSVAVRAVGYYVDQGGYIDNIPGRTFVDPLPDGPQFDSTNASVVEENFNDSRKIGGRISALWDINENWSATISVISESLKNTGYWGSDPSLGDFKIVRFHDEVREDDWTNFGLTIQGDLGFATLTASTSYFDRKIYYEWDNMYYEQWRTSAYGHYDLYDTQYAFGIAINDQNQDRFAQEVRLTSQGESRFQWVAGLYYEDLHDDWFFVTHNPSLMETPAWEYAQYLAYYYNYYGYDVDYPLPPTTYWYASRMSRDTKQKSVFGEMSFDITDKWRITGGIRWFQYDRYLFRQLQSPDGLPPIGGADINGAYVLESKPSETLFKFSTQYQINDSKMVYFLYSQGFRLGGANNPRAVESGYIPEVYDPDTLDNFELGLKSQWLDDRLLLNATLFYMKWDGYQQAAGSGERWLLGIFNAADAEQKGIELSGTMLFTQDFSLTYSFTFSDPQWADDYVFPFGQTIEKGMTMPSSPKRKIYAALDYDIPGAFGARNLFFHYDISYQSEVYNWMDDIWNRNPEGIIESWNVSNLRIGANLENDWSISLVVRNLFDQKAISRLDGSFQREVSDWFGTDFNRDKRTYNRPRTIGLQVRKNF
jgi:outer membrane receptor protein involved in Fe transport